eukprot:6213824-Pleurochrysis_carterae.AAC.1
MSTPLLRRSWSLTVGLDDRLGPRAALARLLGNFCKSLGPPAILRHEGASSVTSPPRRCATRYAFADGNRDLCGSSQIYNGDIDPGSFGVFRTSNSTSIINVERRSYNY